MKRRAFLLGSGSALLVPREAEAFFNIFNAGNIPTYTATGPSTGTTGSPSINFTVAISAGVFNGAQTITVSDGAAGGTFTPSIGSPGTSSVTVTPAISTTSFTFTYNAASNGAKTLSFTNGQGWVNPLPLTYTASGGGGGGAGQIAAIPFGSASFTQQNFGTPGFVQTNGAGPFNGTPGWQAGQVWCIRQTWFNFPSDDIYQFVIPCYVDATGGAVFVNSVMLYIDQLPIQTSIGNTTNNNWFTQFCRNTAPSQNFTFSGPVKAGFHSIRIDLNSAAYEAFPVVNGGNNHSGENHLMHCDGIIISTTGAGLLAEPSPQTRDPSVFPHSSYHFINTPFGANATFDAPSTPRSQSINGTGGNGANLVIKSSSFSVNNWTADANAPVFLITSSDFAQPDAIWPVRAQAGILPSFGGDGAICLIDKTNPRYRYGGGNIFSVNPNGRSGGNGTINATDSYNQNHPIPQVILTNFGLLTLDDLKSGAIKHRLCGGLGFAHTVGGTTGYAPATQTSSKSGMPWPGCMSDYNWSGVYTNSNGVPYGSVLGIPPGVAKPGGLTAGGSMIWDCFQHYGLHLNVTGSEYPTVFFQADGLASSSPILAQIAAALSIITPNLCVMSNPQPIAVGDGFGGGAPVVPLLPGVIQGYPSLGQPPFTVPSSPVGIPIQCAPNGDGGGLGSGQGQGSAVVSPSIPIGSFVVAMLTMDRPNAVPFTNPVHDSAGNSYTVFQPTASSSCIQRALAICASTTAPIGNGANWQPTFTPGSTLWVFLGAYRRPPPPSGSTTLRVANSAFSAASVTTLSTTLAGVQANDLVIGLLGVNNGQDYYFTDPSGFNPLCNFPFLAPTGGISLSSQIAAGSGTVTFNPSWTNASPAQVIAVAFANANIAT